MADKPLLDLTTLIERPTFEVDGKSYELFSPDEIPVLVSHRLSVWGRRIEAIDAGTDEAEAGELDALIDKVVDTAIVAMPADILAKLSGAHKRMVVDVFTGLLLRNRLKVAGAMARAMGVRPTGEKSSPDSSDIMADRHAGGWRKRLARWFARIW